MKRPRFPLIYILNVHVGPQRRPNRLCLDAMVDVIGVAYCALAEDIGVNR